MSILHSKDKRVWDNKLAALQSVPCTCPETAQDSCPACVELIAFAEADDDFYPERKFILPIHAMIYIVTAVTFLRERAVLLHYTHRNKEAMMMRDVGDGQGLGLDGSIAQTLFHMNVRGAKTNNSCGGHFFHGTRYPWVRADRNDDIMELAKEIPGDWVAHHNNTNTLLLPRVCAVPPALEPSIFYRMTHLLVWKWQISRWAKSQAKTHAQGFATSSR